MNDETKSGIPRRLGPCRLVKVLDSGAMGSVHLAELAEETPYAAVGEQVAVKVLHTHRLGEKTGFKRLLREAKLAMGIRDPCLMRAYEIDVAVVDGQAHHFIIMEYVEGGSLQDLLLELGALPEPLVRRVGAQVARGLAALHAAGVVHRDLKPANVLLTADRDVRVGDLGIAHLLDDDQKVTSEGVFIGTSPYASPEQFLGSDLTPASDLYSLGVLLYHLATGVLPFPVGSFMQLMKAHAQEIPPAPSVHNARITTFLDQLVGGLLAKEPSARPQPALAVAEALEVGTVGRLELARPMADAKGAATTRLIGERPLVVGREAELAALQELLDNPRNLKHGSALVSGSRGMGKTTLLSEFASEALAAGDRLVLRGSYADDVTRMGTNPLAASLMAGLGETDVRTLLATSLTALANVREAFSELVLSRGIRRPQSLSQDAEAACLVALVRELTSRQRVAWILDDVHAASLEQRKLLRSLVQVSGRWPLVMVLSIRESDADTFEASLEGGLVKRVPLSRLSSDSVLRLFHDQEGLGELGGALGRAMVKRADGNPLFTVELGRALAEEFPDADSKGSYPLPRTLRSALKARLDDLSEEDRSMLDAAAVGGLGFEAETVADVLRRSTLDVMQRLARLERRKQLVQSVGASFRFDQSLMREVILEELPPALVRLYHSLFADSLARAHEEATSDSEWPVDLAVRVCRHRLRGQRPSEGVRMVLSLQRLLRDRHQHEEAVELSSLAERSSEGASRDWEIAMLVERAESLDSLAWYAEQREATGRAARLAREKEQSVSSVNALVAHCRALLRPPAALDELGRVGLEALEAAASLAASSQAAQAGQLLGSRAMRLGELGEASRLLDAALIAARAGGDSATEGRVLGEMANLHLKRGDQARAAEFLEEVVRRANEDGDLELEAKAIGNLGVTWERLGRLGQARAAASRHVELCRSIGFRQGESNGLINLSLVLIELGEYEEALSSLEQHQRLAEELGGPALRYFALENRALAEAGLGRLASSRETLREAVALAGEAGNGAAEAALLGRLARSLAACGSLTEAEDTAKRARQLAEESGDSDARFWALLGSAEVAWCMRRAADGVSWAEEALRVGEGVGVVSRSEGLFVAARLQLESDSVDEGLRSLELATSILSGSEAMVLGSTPWALQELHGTSVLPGRPSQDVGPPLLRVEGLLAMHAMGKAGYLNSAGEILGQIASELSDAEQRVFWRAGLLPLAFTELSERSDLSELDTEGL